VATLDAALGMEKFIARSVQIAGVNRWFIMARTTLLQHTHDLPVRSLEPNEPAAP